jgi:hypothetical protein
LNANGRAQSPAILFVVSSRHRLDELEMLGLVPGRIVVVRTLPFELMLRTYLATASSFGASMI